MQIDVSFHKFRFFNRIYSHRTHISVPQAGLYADASKAALAVTSHDKEVKMLQVAIKYDQDDISGGNSSHCPFFWFIINSIHHGNILAAKTISNVLRSGFRLQTAAGFLCQE